ncbi:hypothetical protein [Xanthobacter flavus]|uniref:hypothetical protein n=1 Tax=Xanthobacter flavus TaxID=281 RepID=UPI00372B7F84
MGVAAADFKASLEIRSVRCGTCISAKSDLSASFRTCPKFSMLGYKSASAHNRCFNELTMRTGWRIEVNSRKTRIDLSQYAVARAKMIGYDNSVAAQEVRFQKATECDLSDLAPQKFPVDRGRERKWT